jgi:hypothetical protein
LHDEFEDSNRKKTKILQTDPLTTPGIEQATSKQATVSAPTPPTGGAITCADPACRRRSL